MISVGICHTVFDRFMHTFSITLNRTDYMSKWIMISFPLQIREHPMYHLIKAQTKKKMGELTEAIQTLQMAMSLPGVHRAGSSSKSKTKKIELSPSVCVSVFLELAEALWLNGEQVMSNEL